MKKAKKTRKPLPHLFAKLTVAYCIAFATLASLWALWRQGAAEMEGVLAIVLGFFGGELLLLCLKTILKDEKKKPPDGEDEMQTIGFDTEAEEEERSDTND